MKIRILTPWMGEPPVYLDRFRERIGASAPLVEWLFLPVDWSKLRERIEAVTGVEPPEQIHPRKLCDYRPAYGEIFAQEIGDADWWGWCDLDCVFGDLPAFLTPERLEEYELITDNPRVVNGPFTIIKNRPFMNALYRKWPGVDMAFEDERMTGHEYWFTGVVRAHRHVFAVGDHVAWDEKDFTAIVQGAVARKVSGEMRPLFLADVHDSDNEVPAPELRDGKLVDLQGRELMTYHFVRNKHRWPLS